MINATPESLFAKATRRVCERELQSRSLELFSRIADKGHTELRQGLVSKIYPQLCFMFSFKT